MKYRASKLWFRGALFERILQAPRPGSSYWKNLSGRSERTMPEISRFLGIVIRMYYRDHEPAHFHADYGEFSITVELTTGIVCGKFPRRALTAVLEWYALHREELVENWRLAQAESPLQRIAPLE